MTELPPVTFPLKTVFAPCSQCHALTLVRRWHFATKNTPPFWEELAPAHSPVSGEVHRCDGESAVPSQ